MKRVLLLFFVIVCIYPKSYSQYSKGQIKEDFYSAEMYVLYEEYTEALSLYERLAKIDPTNSNYKYRIGQCLMNIPGRKKEAVSFLEAAVKNINLKYKEGRLKETKAPFDAYYYLANAYRINNQIDKALETYQTFKRNLNPSIYDTTVVNLQIESCRNAMELMKAPLFIKKENLGSVINDRFLDYNPVVSGDESVMVYNKFTLQEALFYTKKVNNKWTDPVNIIPDLGLGFEDKNYATSLSNDGKELYIYRPGEDYDGNIYVTKLKENGRWSELIKLNENINTKFWESHATVSHDGKKLYFASNRKGGFDGLDIYVSERDSSDNWGPAKNLGPIINTKYNEDTPFLGRDDKTLFFSSRGHFNIGGYDIFYSSIQDNGQWSVPLNLGFPVNSTDDDIFFNPVNDGYQAYYAMIDSGGFGLTDIYRIEIYSKDHPRKFFVRGIVQVKDLMSIFHDSIKVSALNLEDPNARVVVYTNPETGEYKFELPQGKYLISYEAKGAEKIISNLELPLTNPADSFVLPGTTLPKTDFIADLTVGSNKNISVTRGDTVAIPLKVEPNSILIVEHWLGNKLLYTEKFIINDTAFIYKTVPLAGNNRIVFKLSDKFNNTTTSEVFITRKKQITAQPVVKPEYSRVIAQKLVDPLLNTLKNRSGDKLANVIDKSDMSKQKFGRVDDLIEFIRKEADTNNISTDEVDKLALRIAVMDNVLTQAAVNLVAANVKGELKEILDNLNIYEAGIKTWTDLQNYVSGKSKGKYTPDDLNRIAAEILAGIDPSIATLRSKILIYSDKTEKGSSIKTAVTLTDKNNINKSGKWLRSVYDESLKQKLTEEELAGMFAALSSFPGTLPDKYLVEITGYSDEAFAVYLKSIDLKKAKIKNTQGLILYLIRNRDKGLYPENAVFEALAKMIVAKDLPPDSIKPVQVITEKPTLLALWIVLGASFLFLFIIWLRRRKKSGKNTE
jgi:tetratricopeptide (TPR) repeat protein